MNSPETNTTLEAELNYLARIDSALFAGSRVAEQLYPGEIWMPNESRQRIGAYADQEINRAVRDSLQSSDEGWLSEEDPDDLSRLVCNKLWIVDPLDGTREFIAGIPEWSISIALIVNGVPIAGGIVNPATGERFLGSRQSGVMYNGKPSSISNRTNLEGAIVLASRQEFLRGEWQRFERHAFSIRPTGSIAYKLALVATGRADATWTSQPKHLWDVAAGIALINAAGGRASSAQNSGLTFNSEDTRLPGLIAAPPGIWWQLMQLVNCDFNWDANSQ